MDILLDSLTSSDYDQSLAESAFDAQIDEIRVSATPVQRAPRHPQTIDQPKPAAGRRTRGVSTCSPSRQAPHRAAKVLAKSFFPDEPLVDDVSTAPDKIRL